MRNTRLTLRVRALAALLLGAALHCGAQTTTIQSQTPTADQLRMLENLTPSQRAAINSALARSGQGQTLQPLAPQTPQLTMDESLESMRRMGVAPEGEFPPTVLPEQPRLEPESELVVELVPRIDLGERLVVDPATGAVTFDGKPLGERISRLIGRNVFKLDRYGMLTMEGAYRMQLSGLTADEAAARIGAEPDLRIFDVYVTILPLEPTGVEALELFGSRLFTEVPTSFAPATDIPVPADYVVGPGDTVRVQLFGNDNQELELIVSRDGTINFPGIGPITVAGLTFDDMRAEIDKRVAEQLIGVQASVTLGMLRSVRVFVMGDAVRPGSYDVSSLSTMTNALFASGGILPNGSLRNVTLMRGGQAVGRLDLYRMLLHGDSSGDQRIQPGDVIFVPPIGRTVSVEGEVARPAIYELAGETTVGEVVQLAGGLLPTAVKRSAYLERIAGGHRTVVEVDLTTPAGLATKVANGDRLRVRALADETIEGVHLTGHVRDPRAFAWRPGLRLTDVIRTADMLLSGADLNYVLVRRERPLDRRVEAVSADLAAALAAPGSEDDILLQDRDRIIVFDMKSDRGPVLAPLLTELAAQARDGRAVPEVDIAGRVNNAGRYPLEPGMRVSDLLRAGGLNEAAYTLEAELTRYTIVDGESRETELIEIDLQRVLAGDETADLPLQAHDFLTIKELPQWREQESVTVSGEVRFPGVYPIHRNETLSSVLERAGGLTDVAFPEGSVFVREDLKKREEEQIERLATRLESDLVAFSIQSAQQDVDAAQVLSLGQAMLQQLRDAEPTGRLVVDLARIMRGGPDNEYDVVLKNGDQLFVPKRTQEITVVGEVQNPTSHLYQPGLTRDDYIARSGGTTEQADPKRIYVVRANGEVLTAERSVWFRRSTADRMRPGDTIVVPLDADRVAPLARWASVSQIIYQLALAAASANAVGVF
jgi:protein involved in polysaccharide export with SLBB domain